MLIDCHQFCFLFFSVRKNSSLVRAFEIQFNISQSYFALVTNSKKEKKVLSMKFHVELMLHESKFESLKFQEFSLLVNCFSTPRSYHRLALMSAKWDFYIHVKLLVQRNVWKFFLQLTLRCDAKSLLQKVCKIN